jgi:hypothetical protein
MWSNFLKHTVIYLLAKGRDHDDVVAAAVGLIVYGVTTGEELQGVAGQPPDDEKFKRQLAAGKYGVPAAILWRQLGRVREQGHVLLRQQRAATGRRSRSVLPAALSQHLRRAAWDGRGAMMQRRARASTTYVSRTRPSRALHGVRRPPQARKYETHQKSWLHLPLQVCNKPVAPSKPHLIVLMMERKCCAQPARAVADIHNSPLASYEERLSASVREEVV